MSKNKIILIIVIVAVVALIGYSRINNSDSLPPETQSTLTESEYRGLLTETDLEELGGEDIQFTVENSNLYETALNSLPDQVANLDSWFGTSYTDEKTGNDISVNIMDLKSEDFIDAQLTKLGGAFGIEKIETLVGEQTFGAELNVDTIGSVIVFSEGDKVVAIQTSFLNEQKPILTFDQTLLVAQRISERLAEREGTTASPNKPTLAQVGDLFPDFDLVEVDGSALSLDTLKGKPAIIWFTTSWCIPCQIGAKDTSALDTELGGNAFDVLVVFVDPTEGDGELRNWRNTFANPDWMVAFDNFDDGLAGRLAVKFLDTKYLLDENGTIVNIDERQVNETYIDLIREVVGN